jgi:hypothetical protein
MTRIHVFSAGIGLGVFLALSVHIIIISGTTAQSRALASLTGFVTGILRYGLSAPRSTTRDI